MTTTKLTNSKALEMVLLIEEVKNNDTLAKKLIAMKEQFDKKSGKATKGTKLTKGQKENEEIKAVIMSVLQGQNSPKSIKELQTENEVLSVNLYSNQKLSALIRQLIKDGLVERTEEKRVAKFSVVSKEPLMLVSPVEEVEPVVESEAVESPVVEVENFEEVEEDNEPTDEELQALLEEIEE